MAIERLEFGGLHLIIIIIIIIILLYEWTVVVEKGATMWALGFHRSPPVSALFTDISPNVRSVRFGFAVRGKFWPLVASHVRFVFPKKTNFYGDHLIEIRVVLIRCKNTFDANNEEHTICKVGRSTDIRTPNHMKGSTGNDQVYPTWPSV